MVHFKTDFFGAIDCRKASHCPFAILCIRNRNMRVRTRASIEIRPSMRSSQWPEGTHRFARQQLGALCLLLQKSGDAQQHHTNFGGTLRVDRSRKKHEGADPVGCPQGQHWCVCARPCDILLKAFHVWSFVFITWLLRLLHHRHLRPLPLSIPFPPSLSLSLPAYLHLHVSLSSLFASPEGP
jgi:hypothetical protein